MRLLPLPMIINAQLQCFEELVTSDIFRLHQGGIQNARYPLLKGFQMKMYKINNLFPKRGYRCKPPLPYEISTIFANMIKLMNQWQWHNQEGHLLQQNTAFMYWSPVRSTAMFPQYISHIFWSTIILIPLKMTSTCSQYYDSFRTLFTSQKAKLVYFSCGFCAVQKCGQLSIFRNTVVSSRPEKYRFIHMIHISDGNIVNASQT